LEETRSLPFVGNAASNQLTVVVWLQLSLDQPLSRTRLQMLGVSRLPAEMLLDQLQSLLSLQKLEPDINQPLA
jgi:hypothetical protein